MKTFITILMTLTLSSVAMGQAFRDGIEYKAQNNSFRCKYVYSSELGLHFYEFTNFNNVLKDMDPKIRGSFPPEPIIESYRKLFELLYEVYGGRAKMRAMGSESITIDFYIGMDFKTKEVRITLSSETEGIKTTVAQVEAIEELIKERIRFTFDRDHPSLRDAIWLSAFNSFIISEIPAGLQRREYRDPRYSRRIPID